MSQFSLNGAAFAIIILIFGCYGGPQPMNGLEFGYDGHMGPDHWGEQYNTCDGKFQSPINIDDLKVVKKNFKPLVMNGFNVPATTAEVFNNGHTVLANLKFAETPTIESGPLDGKGIFKFSQFHFHWGDNDTIGSEDRINNIAYPAELHMVFFNERYDSVNEALTFDGGIAVLAFFYKFRINENHKYKELTRLLEKVQEPNKRASFGNPPLLKDFIHDNLTAYYTYTGSLTTPPCSEEVTWIDFEQAILISPEQLDRFRSLYTHDGLPLKHNFRPIQPLNDRIVYKAMPLLSPAIQVSDKVDLANDNEVPESREKATEPSNNNATDLTGKRIFIVLLMYLYFYI